jgi:hypothetical protein
MMMLSREPSNSDSMKEYLNTNKNFYYLIQALMYILIHKHASLGEKEKPCVERLLKIIYLAEESFTLLRFVTKNVTSDFYEMVKSINLDQAA